ncbi:hypothetical protein BDW62DRAFT_140156 [Aspergillus aurantiobrunneus]
MKLSVAVTLHLALLAAAAPASVNVKRDDVSGDTNADIATKIAYGSLKSAADMMDSYNDENMEDEEPKDSKPPSYGNMPANMTPNSEANFPGADGQKPKSHNAKPSTKASEQAMSSPSSPTSTSPSTHGAASPVTSSSPTQSEDAIEMKQSPTSSSTPTPSSSSKPSNPLENLPIVGNLAKGLFKGAGSR